MKKLIQSTSDMLYVRKAVLNEYTAKLDKATSQSLSYKIKKQEIPGELLEKISVLRSKVEIWKAEVERFKSLAHMQTEATVLK